MNKHRSKQEIKETLTLTDIKDDYQKFGYLTDAQVEWLMDKFVDIKRIVNSQGVYPDHKKLMKIQKLTGK